MRCLLIVSSPRHIGAELLARCAQVRGPFRPVAALKTKLIPDAGCGTMLAACGALGAGRRGPPAAVHAGPSAGTSPPPPAAGNHPATGQGLGGSRDLCTNGETP